MSTLLQHQLARLADMLAELKVRVRVAIAGELAQAVGGAVRQVVEAVVAGHPDRIDPVRPGRDPAARPAWDDGDRWHDPWADDEDRFDRRPEIEAADEPVGPSPATTGVPAAAAAGVQAARWWLRRGGAWPAAAGLGLAVAAAGAVGGPAIRSAVALLAAAADLLAATDALGHGAARLEHL